MKQDDMPTLANLYHKRRKMTLWAPSVLQQALKLWLQLGASIKRRQRCAHAGYAALPHERPRCKKHLKQTRLRWATAPAVTQKPTGDTAHADMHTYTHTRLSVSFRQHLFASYCTVW